MTQKNRTLYLTEDKSPFRVTVKSSKGQIPIIIDHPVVMEGGEVSTGFSIDEDSKDCPDLKEIPSGELMLIKEKLKKIIPEFVKRILEQANQEANG